jgi:hypothetical protein
MVGLDPTIHRHAAAHVDPRAADWRRPWNGRSARVKTHENRKMRDKDVQR